MAIKKLIIRGIMSLILCVNAYPSFSNIEDRYPNCSEFTNSDGAITYTGGDGIESCRLSPEMTKLKLYYISLCQEQPTVQNFRTVCSPLFDNANGKEVSLSINTQVSIADEVTLREGTYSYAAILVASTSSFSIKKKFSPARTGKTGTGEWCWTLDAVITDARYPGASGNIADCGATPPALIGTQVFSSHAAYPSAAIGFTSSRTGSNEVGSYVLHYLLSDETLTSGVSTDYSTWPETKYLLGIQTFNTPVTISPNTTNINTGFLLTNAFDVRVTGATNTNINMFSPSNFGFKIISNN